MVTQNFKILLEQRFTLLDSPKEKWFLVIFTGIFTTLFIVIFNPFGIQNMPYQNAFGHFLSILTVGIWGALSLLVTQFGLRKAFKRQTFTVRTFALWLIFEILFLTTISFFIFGELDRPLLNEFRIVFKYTLGLAFLPYFLACLIITVVKLSKNERSHLSNKSISTQVPLVIKEKNGKVALTLQPEDLLYLKSENNYTQVVYLDHEIQSKKLVRTNLKALESELSFPELLRIHRSYMINSRHINQVKRYKGSFQLQLKGLPELWLKVSDSYRNIFDSRIKF